ncbi:hypothetical protein [Halalkaliarchaeum desulfuricum]|nr:hypothetical protein [Halalkaliarchaeum desulfuricum]
MKREVVDMQELKLVDTGQFEDRVDGPVDAIRQLFTRTELSTW